MIAGVNEDAKVFIKNILDEPEIILHKTKVVCTLG